MKKIILILTLLLLIIGVAYATDVGDFKAPNGWETKGGGLFFSSNPGEAITVMNYTDENVKDFIDNEFVSIKNDTSTHVMTYKDSDLHQHGVMEIVEVEGSRFIVQSWAGEQSSTTDDMLLANLQNFNNVNNLKPIAA